MKNVARSRPCAPILNTIEPALTGVLKRIP